jgi:hypothetical protein
MDHRRNAAYRGRPSLVQRELPLQSTRLANDDQPKDGGINLPLGCWRMGAGGAREMPCK